MENIDAPPSSHRRASRRQRTLIREDGAAGARATDDTLSASHPRRYYARREGVVRASFLILAIALAGCTHQPDPAELQARAAARAAADDAKCQSYGAKPGTSDYIQCRENLDNQRAQMRAAVAGALVGGALSHPAPAPAPTPAPQPAIRTPSLTTCNTIGATTNCSTN